MPVTIRVLAQSFPSAATETTLYTCATTSVVISSLLICNKSDSSDVITVRVCIAGDADNDKQLIFSGASLGPNATVDLTAGLTLANTDVIKVTSANGTSAFSLYGQENS